MEKQLLAKLQKYHLGRSKAASSKELEVAFSVTGREIRRAISTLRMSLEPICSGETGYFYANTTQELTECINQLDGRINKINKAKVGLANALNKFDGNG